MKFEMMATMLAAVLVAALPSLAGDALKSAHDDPASARGLIVLAAPTTHATLQAQAKATPAIIAVFCPDEQSAAAINHAMRKAGCFGQVTAQAWDAQRGFAIAPNTAATVIVDSGYIENAPSKEAAMAICRPLGTVYYGNGDLTKTVKSRPESMGDWPMYNGDSANSLHSPDTLVGPARGIQWMAGPTNQDLPYIFVDGAVALTEFHDLEADRKQIHLIARDAFSGVPIWDRLLAEPANRYALVMNDGRIYIHSHHYEGEYGGLTVALDANTGALLKSYDQGLDLRVTKAMIKKDRRVWREHQQIATELQLRLADGVLIQIADRHVIALDVESGKRLWEYKPKGKASLAYPTVGGGMFFIAEGPDVENNAAYTLWPSVVPNHIHAMDLKTGKTLWTWTWNDERHGKRGEIWNMQYEDGRIASAMTRYEVVNKQGHEHPIPHGLILDARNGKEIYFGHEENAWPGSTGRGHSHVHMLLRGDRVYTVDGGSVFGTWQVDKPKDHVAVQEAFKKYGMRPIACSMYRSTPNWWIIGPNAYPMDLKGKPYTNRSGRSGCDIGSFPANGMIYLPPNTCACQPYLPATKVYHSRELEAPISAESRLKVGDAQPAPARGSAKDRSRQWPQFMQSPARRMWIDGQTPLKLKQLWQVKVDPESVHSMVRQQWDVDAVIRGSVTAPSVAEGVLVYAEPHRHQVVARDPATGKLLWRATVEGRVDLPPSIHQGVVYVGTRDGYVYAINRDTGELIWRFLAAPTTERIMVNAQLESVWPVYGAVPVEDVGVYVVAGRHSSSDGGVWWYLLDERTGQIKNTGRWEEGEKRPFSGYRTDHLPVDRQPVQNSLAVVSENWFQLPQQIFKRDGEKLIPNTDRKLTDTNLKVMNVPDRVQLKDRVLRFGNNALIGEPIQTAGGWRKPRFGGTLARMFAIDPDENRFVTVGGGPTTASARGGGGNSDVHRMSIRDEPIVTKRFEQWVDVKWHHDEVLFQQRGARRAVTALAASDNAVYLGATVRNFNRKYEEQRKAMPYRLRILDLATGQVQQDLPLPGITTMGGIAVADRHVYVATEDGSITAFAPAE